MPRKLVKDRLDEHSMPEPNSGCWIWLGAVTDYRYPKHIRAKMRVNGKDTASARAAWEDTNGEIPDGLHVLHRCDNPLCVNLDHLFLGTNLDNMRDKVAKGRAAGGPRATPEMCIRTRARRWCAYGYVTIDGKTRQVSLGSYPTRDAAVEARRGFLATRKGA